jgi:hypothetical protein
LRDEELLQKDRQANRWQIPEQVGTFRVERVVNPLLNKMIFGIHQILSYSNEKFSRPRRGKRELSEIERSVAMSEM